MQRDQAKREIEAANDQITLSESKRKELKEVKKALYEGMSKEVKGCDKASLKSFQSAAKSDVNARAVADRLAQFITGDKTATWATQGAKLAVNAEEFQNNVRAIKHNALSTQYLEESLLWLMGEDGEGAVVKTITDPKNAKKYLYLYPFVKTLSKVCQWCLNSQRDDFARQKIKNAQACIQKNVQQEKRNNAIQKAID